jgi:hypothetical protein
VTIVSSGYDGTVTQEDWADMATFFGSDTGVSSSTDLTVVGVAGTRVTSVSAGTAWGWGVIDVLTGDNSVTFTANGTGATRWDAVVLRRNWGTGITTVNVVPGSSVETIPSLTVNPGTIADQVIALVGVPNGATSLVGATVRRYVQWPAQITAGLYPPHSPSYMQQWKDISTAGGGITKHWSGSAWVDPLAVPGWTPLSLSAGYSSTGIPAAYRLHEGMVDFRGTVHKSTPFPSSNLLTFATLPVGARALNTVRKSVGFASSTITQAFIQTDTAGSVGFYYFNNTGAAIASDVFLDGLRFSAVT